MVETVNYIYFFNTKDLIQASKNEKIKLIKKSPKFIKNISKGKNLEGAPLDRIFKRLFLEEIETWQACTLGKSKLAHGKKSDRLHP